MEGKNSSEKTPSIGCTKSRGVTSILLSTTLTNGPRVRRLVLAEKFSAARRVAQILSEGKTARVRADGITYFQFSRQGDEYTLFPLRGHVVEIDYPADVQDWKSTDLDYLIDLEPVRHESPPALHDILRLLADATDEVVLATDYEREDFVPRTFWNVVLKSASPALEATAVGGPFWDREGAQAVVALAGLGGESATVARIELSQHREPPPAPFNTTSLLAKASREGISAARAMAAAQDRYVHGEISYPRTGNTVYPPSLPVHDLLRRLHDSPYGPYADRLLAQPTLEASRGPVQTTDHPPIYPTAAPAKRRDSVRSRMYDLIARRFLATFSPPSVTAVTDVRLVVGDSAFA